MISNYEMSLLGRDKDSTNVYSNAKAFAHHSNTYDSQSPCDDNTRRIVRREML